MIEKPKPPPVAEPQKRVTLTESKGRWSLEFDGVVTRRDIARIQRTLRVEYTKAERKRLVESRRVRREQDKETNNGR